jgi:ligand-binding sensor domain-containing protein/signal transduction histidine kinase
MNMPGTFCNFSCRNIYTYLSILLLLASCRSDQQFASVEMASLYPAPLIIAINTDEGYKINPLTGDSIQPIINSLGDTIKTGVPLLLTGRSIHPDGLKQPKTKAAGDPKVVTVNRNVYALPKTLTIIPVNKNSLETFTPGTDTSSAVLVNSTGDTVLTGVPIAVKGKVVRCKQPQATKALPPRSKDNVSINMKYLDVEQGMNSSHVLSILEDKHGNLWFGTGGGGVSMYNGETFMHYTEKEGLSNNLVWSILEDSQGNLWFGTYSGGVCMFNGEIFTHFTEKEGLSNRRVRSILEDSQGNLWFGTWKGGVSRYDGDTFTHFTEKEGLSNHILSMLEDSRGNLWFGTNGKGVYMYNGETFTHFSKKEGLSDNIVQSILEDHQGNLWFGTEHGGVSRYDGDAFTHFTKKEGLSDNNVNSILEDSGGNLWFGTEYGGVSLYNGESFTHYNMKNGLSDNNINSIFEDSYGNLLFGTEYGGVSIYDAESFTHYAEKEGLNDRRVQSMLEDRRGNLWFSTWGGGASRYDGETIESYTEEEGLCNQVVQSILEDSQGNLWFGTDGGGVIKYNGLTFTHFTDEVGLSSNKVVSILEDSQGNLWFGTSRGGVNRFDGNTFTHFTEKEGLSNNDVRSILEDSQGNLWFGTYGGGVSRYDGETIMHFTEKEGLSNNTVWSIMEDSHGNLWFGTFGGGVCKYNGRTFTHYTEKEGLSNNIIQSILEDRNGNIWISTEKGLNTLVSIPDDFDEEYNKSVIYTYGKQDGLKGMDFILNSTLLDSKNRIWWGSSTSAIMLDMNKFKIPDKIPVMQLSQIEINEQFADYRHMIDSSGIEIKFDGVAGFYNYPLNLELPFSKNHLTFHFSAIDWSAPQKIKYSYKMEGLNDQWSTPTSEAKADYRSLPYGTYTFIVRAIGGAQKWSEPFEYSFSIDPPWWHTWLARSGYGITALLVIFGFARWRTAKLSQRKKELEAEVSNATLKIREQKEEVESQRDEIVATNEALKNQKRELEFTLDNLKLTQSQLIQSEKMASVGLLTAGIAHELNNPINFVSGNVGPLKRDIDDLFSLIKNYEEIIESYNVKNEISDAEALKEKLDYTFLIKEIISLLEGIEEGAIRSSQIIKGLRSFSRLDEEKCQHYDIHEGIDSSLILLHNQIKGRIKVSKDYGDFDDLECFPGKLNQVFMNILTNSIQAIEGQGEIFIQTISSDIGIKIIFKDNGEGMTPEVKKHIFEPFFTTKEVGKGTGLGLSISFGIIEQHNGNIDIISEPGKGTEIIISLPRMQSSLT